MFYHILRCLGERDDVPSTSLVSESRSSSRSNVFLAAALAGDGGSQSVRIRNLSADGALLEGRDLPKKGEKAQLRRGSLFVQGKIAWENARFCGIRFEHPILVPEWVRRSGSEAQLRVDAAIEQVRGGATLHWPEPMPSSGNIFEGISGELLQICERIAALPLMSVPLAEELMKIEALARTMELALRHRR